MSFVLILALVASAVLLASWQAVILTVIVLAVHLVVGRLLTSRIRYVLWCCVLIRLIVPHLPESSVSIFNVLPTSIAVTSGEQPATTAAGVVMPEASNSEDVGEAILLSDIVAANDYQSAQIQAIDPRSDWQIIAFTIWLLGALFFFVRFVLNLGSLRKVLRECSRITDERFLRVLAECQLQTGVRRMPTVVVTHRNVSPAVVGYFRPTIIMPTVVTTDFSDEELRHVLLHELAHVRCGDTLVQRLCDCVQILHWFNPAVWLAIRQVRIEREIACDAFVLSRTVPVEPESYGRTAIKILELVSGHQPLPSAVGILDRKPAVLRRIAMIGSFQTPSVFRRAASVVLLAAVVFTGLTDARSAGTNDEKTAAESSGQTNKSASAPTEQDDGYKIFLKGIHYAGDADPFQISYSWQPQAKNANAANAQEDTPEKISLMMHAAPDGTLNSLQLGSIVIPVDGEQFTRLTEEMKKWASMKGRTDVKHRELEIRADTNLDYSEVIKAITACTGQKNPKSRQLDRFVGRIKFAPAKKLTTLPVKIGFMRAKTGERISEKMMVLIGERVADLDGTEDALRAWIRETGVDPASVVVKIHGDKDAETKGVQAIIKIAQALGFQRIALSVLQPVEEKHRSQEKVIFLKNSDAAQVLNILEGAFGNAVKVVADVETNSIVATGTEEGLDMFEKAVRKLDEPSAETSGELRVFSLKELDPVQVVETLNAMFASEPEKPLIEADKVGQRLIVRGSKSALEQIGKLLQQLGEKAEAVQPVP